MHDANKRVLNDGDGVSRKTKVENIRLVEPRHGIDCKFDGISCDATEIWICKQGLMLILGRRISMRLQCVFAYPT